MEDEKKCGEHVPSYMPIARTHMIFIWNVRICHSISCLFLMKFFSVYTRCFFCILPAVCDVRAIWMKFDHAILSNAAVFFVVFFVAYFWIRILNFRVIFCVELHCQWNLINFYVNDTVSAYREQVKISKAMRFFSQNGTKSFNSL